MANHPNRSNISYFMVSPRGFANEITYFKVPADKVAEVDKAFDGYADDVSRGGYCRWTTDRAAKIPGVAVDWADRAYVGFGHL